MMYKYCICRVVCINYANNVLLKDYWKNVFVEIHLKCVHTDMKLMESLNSDLFWKICERISGKK